MYSKRVAILATVFAVTASQSMLSVAIAESGDHSSPRTKASTPRPIEKGSVFSKLKDPVFLKMNEILSSRILESKVDKKKTIEVAIRAAGPGNLGERTEARVRRAFERHHLRMESGAIELGQLQDLIRNSDNFFDAFHLEIHDKHNPGRHAEEMALLSKILFKSLGLWSDKEMVFVNEGLLSNKLEVDGVEYERKEKGWEQIHELEIFDPDLGLRKVKSNGSLR